MLLKFWSISGSLSNVRMKKAALHAAGLTVTPELEKVRTFLSWVHMYCQHPNVLVITPSKHLVEFVPFDKGTLVYQS